MEEIKDAVQELNKTLDVKRTDELFDASIKSADALAGRLYDENSLKAARMTVNFGNLHVNTAKTKLSAVRLIGYRNEANKLKQNIDRKIRNGRKYGETN